MYLPRTAATLHRKPAASPHARGPCMPSRPGGLGASAADTLADSKAVAVRQQLQCLRRQLRVALPPALALQPSGAASWTD